jgi:hypothetical protein
MIPTLRSACGGEANKRPGDCFLFSQNLQNSPALKRDRREGGKLTHGVVANRARYKSGWGGSKHDSGMLPLRAVRGGIGLAPTANRSRESLLWALPGYNAGATQTKLAPAGTVAVASARHHRGGVVYLPIPDLVG